MTASTIVSKPVGALIPNMKWQCMKPVQFTVTICYDMTIRGRTVPVAGAARAGSAAAFGRATTVARAREILLVVADLDDAEPLGNCADAAQYVNAVRIRTPNTLRW